MVRANKHPDILEDQLSWKSTMNGVSVDATADVRVHPCPSGTIVVIMPGVDGSVDGFKDKYIQMANKVHGAFAIMLSDIQPSDGILNLYKQILISQAARENGRINTKIKNQRDMLDEIATRRLSAIEERVGTKDLKEKRELSELVDKLDADKIQANKDLKSLEHLQGVQEANIKYAVDAMFDIAKQWLDADYDLQQWFQTMLFPEGVVLNTETLEFGTTKISPLYRYVPNKKDLSDKEKSLLVTLPHPLYNSTVAEVVRWNDVIRNISVESNLLHAT